MLAISSEVWLPIATLVIGYIFSLATEAFRDRRQTRREREARAAERTEMREAHERERIERRNEFQRETLLELQEVLHKLVRTYGEEHHQDLMTAKQAGHWQQYQLGGDISDRGFAATQRVNILVARVGDEEVRLAVREMEEAGHKLMFARSEDESAATMMRSGNAFQRANERIGVLLQAL